MKLKLWTLKSLHSNYKCTKFEPNRLTPISKPAQVSQAEALKSHCP